VVVVMNHPSWWDPLVAMVLKREWFGEVPAFGGMAAEELERYPFFKRLGLFPVRKGAAGARDWKEAMRAIAECERAVLWTTPQGRFVDVRERGVPLMSGVAMTEELQLGCVYLAVAVEYVSGRARLPEVYVSVGEALEAEEMRGLGRAEVVERLRQRLEAEQDALANGVCAGDPLRWEAVRGGDRGLRSVYGWWRRLVGGKAVGEVRWEEVSRGGRRA
jgi:1-acyl-sn-glycerol-3-phosphate acyltransferase